MIHKWLYSIKKQTFRLSFGNLKTSVAARFSIDFEATKTTLYRVRGHQMAPFLQPHPTTVPYQYGILTPVCQFSCCGRYCGICKNRRRDVISLNQPRGMSAKMAANEIVKSEQWQLWNTVTVYFAHVR